jgi:hypothetical protein
VLRAWVNMLLPMSQPSDCAANICSQQ